LIFLLVMLFISRHPAHLKLKNNEFIYILQFQEYAEFINEFMPACKQNYGEKFFIQVFRSMQRHHLYVYQLTNGTLVFMFFVF